MLGESGVLGQGIEVGFQVCDGLVVRGVGARENGSIGAGTGAGTAGAFAGGAGGGALVAGEVADKVGGLDEEQGGGIGGVGQ